MSKPAKCQCGSYVAIRCRRCKRMVNGALIQRQGEEILAAHKAGEWLRDELARKTQEIVSLLLPWYARRWYAAVRWLTTFDRGAGG